jgi:putative restriction endonuclease
VPRVDPDFDVRLAAIEHLHALSRRYDDVIPRAELLRNLDFRGHAYPLVNPQSGIHRPRRFRGPAALTLVTTAPKPNAPPPYEDTFDEVAGTIAYSYRQGPINSPDNRALRAACAEQVPLIYLMGVAPSLYSVAAPVYVVDDRPAERTVLLQIGSRITDLSPAGLRSDEDVRRYAVGEARYRLHQYRFRFQVLNAYAHRCTICALREHSLLQAAHIVEDADQRGAAVVTNGLALCAIHHLAYDRQVLGIDPRGVVHIASRVLEEHDGPMLREGLQSFHGLSITQPARVENRPDPERLDLRFELFLSAA